MVAAAAVEAEEADDNTATIRTQLRVSQLLLLLLLSSFIITSYVFARVVLI